MVAVPYAERLLISYTAKHPLSKREKVGWYFCFCLKKQIHTITIQTNAGSGVGCINTFSTQMPTFLGMLPQTVWCLSRHQLLDRFLHFEK